MTSPIPRPTQEKKEQIEATVMLTKGGRPRSLYERMADFAIPGVSIAVINDYQIEWACGYGVCKAGEPEQVTPDTLFQACSISKVVTAIAVLRLVEEMDTTTVGEYELRFGPSLAINKTDNHLFL